MTQKTVRSMTGFASARGEGQGASWAWEMRSVNGKGLDLRLRVPDWVEGLEASLRTALGKALARGSVSLNLRVVRDDSQPEARLNTDQLDLMLDALAQVETRAAEQGVALRPATSAEVLMMRGVLDQSGDTDAPTGPLREALLAQLSDLLAAFNDMRDAEGAALDKILRDQLDSVAEMTAQAADIAVARKEDMANTLRTNLARVLENTQGVDEDRLTQELAVIAVKSDVTEEIDRLGAHVTAAKALLDQGSPVGRKLDFLMQEFNREANTLCSKSQSKDLTAVGLDLKAVIDQMREQVQNVE